MLALNARSYATELLEKINETRDASKRGNFYFVNQRPAKVPFELCRRVDGGYLKILGDGI